jgi:Tfp pilus assembly pilus retraction ATPase PilT
MIGTPAIRNLIREDKVAQMYSAIQTGQATACRRLTSEFDFTEAVRGCRESDAWTLTTSWT